MLSATPAEAAAHAYGPGFWAGASDGFLALLKLLVSLVAPVSIVDPAAMSWHYDAGYYVGVLIFAAAAGLAASAPVSEPSHSVPRARTLTSMRRQVR